VCAVTSYLNAGPARCRMFRARASCAQRRFAAVRRLVGHDRDAVSNGTRVQSDPRARGVGRSAIRPCFPRAATRVIRSFQRAGIGPAREIHGLDRILQRSIETLLPDWWTSSRGATWSVAANSAYGSSDRPPPPSAAMTCSLRPSSGRLARAGCAAVRAHPALHSYSDVFPR